MKLKNIFFLVILNFITFSYAQKITFREVMNGHIYTSEADRYDRLKNTQAIEEAKIIYYNKEVDTLNLSSDSIDLRAIIKFAEDGKLQTRIEKFFNGDVYHDYTYDDKKRLTNRTQYQLQEDGKKIILEITTFKYSKNKVDQSIFHDTEFYVRREFILKNDFITKVNEYEEDNSPVGFRTFYKFDYERMDFWDYVEGINTSKDIFRPSPYGKHTYDDNGKLATYHIGNSTEIYTYKNDNLIVYKQVRDKDNAEVRKTYYQYDDKGNWIKKSYVFEGELVYYITREITYR